MKEMRAKRATIAHLITIKSEKDQISNRNGIKFIYCGSILLKYKFAYSHYRIVLSRHRFTVIKLKMTRLLRLVNTFTSFIILMIKL